VTVEIETPLENLIEAARAGDAQAFASIVSRFESMARSLALGMLRDPHAAEDAIQDAFIEAFYALGALRNTAAFPGWFKRIVFKHCDRQLRRRADDALDPALVTNSVASADGPHDMLDALYLRERVHDALETLNVRQRQLTQLFYLDGFGQQEIVEALGWPLSTVKKQLYLARAQLRAAMQDLQETNDMTNETKTPTPTSGMAQRIEFLLAVHARDAARAASLAKHNPRVLGEFTEWADVDSSSYYPLGYTALHFAVGVGDLTLTDALIDAGADVNAMSKRQFATPLHVAAMQRRNTFITRLLAAGANVGAVNTHGHSALHTAAYRGHVPSIKALLTAGAAVALKDAGRRTPLDWAQHRGNGEAAAVLRAAGAIPAGVAPKTRPSLERRSAMLQTGVKIVDLFAPLTRGGVNALFTPLSGVGKFVTIEQLIETLARQYAGRAVFLIADDPNHVGADFALELNDVGLEGDVDYYIAAGNQASGMTETVSSALERLDRARETLILADARYAEIPGLQAQIEGAAGGSVTVLWFGDHSAGAEPEHFAHVRSLITFEPWRAQNGFWPSIDPLRSRSMLIDGAHTVLVARAQRLLRRFEDLRYIVERDPRGINAFDSEDDRQTVTRAQRLHAFLSQPLPIAELWTAEFGEVVPFASALEGLAAVLDGTADAADQDQLRAIAGTQLGIRH
jgi:RNA polymerase sigma factor (sigma-70 family)